MKDGSGCLFPYWAMCYFPPQSLGRVFFIAIQMLHMVENLSTYSSFTVSWIFPLGGFIFLWSWRSSLVMACITDLGLRKNFPSHFLFFTIFELWTAVFFLCIMVALQCLCLFSHEMFLKCVVLLFLVLKKNKKWMVSGSCDSLPLINVTDCIVL